MHTLFRQDPTRIRVPHTPPHPDRVPASLASGTPAHLKTALGAALGAEVVRTRVTDLVRYASDASPYRLIPQAVVVPKTLDDVAAALRFCADHGRHATFRSAGTSLSGQSQGDDLLIDVREHFGGVEVLDAGARVRLLPGTVLAHANAVLARWGRTLGPDPASQAACTIGGVLANNAAGMRCTPERSAYATLRDCVFVLPSGTTIDTSDPDAEARFAASEPALATGLIEIRDEIRRDLDLVARLRRKYSIRNTSGYQMRAFLDADTPLQIFTRLLVGSEGTLAFIAEATLDTFPLPQAVALWWLVVPTITDAVELVGRITPLGASAVEVVRAKSLISNRERNPRLPSEWRDLDAGGYAVLVEFGTHSDAELARIDAELQLIASTSPLVIPAPMHTDPTFIADSWRVRSSLASDLATQRAPGEIIVNEDVCFPFEQLADGVTALTELLTSYGYGDAVVGHAAYGNMHFTLTTRLDQADERDRYARFMSDLVELMIGRFDGSLKAEHGTGLNMSPYVEREWGPTITGLMWRLRELADPCSVLAPDVLITRDPGVNLRRFRTEPAIDELIDGCIECGFCEPVCPSRHVTTTPRQRIALRREMARQGSASPITRRLLADYQYDAIETCAVDSLCAVACPYGIDTGTLMKHFRADESTPRHEAIADAVSERFDVVEKLARGVLKTTDALQARLGATPLRTIANAARTLVSTDLMPTVPGPLPAPDRIDRVDTIRSQAAAVYFPACVNRIFGSGREMSLPDALLAVSDRAGRPLWIPGGIEGVCCGTIWASKGYEAGRDRMYSRVARSLVSWTRGGRLPVVVDASSCSHGLIHEVGPHLTDPWLADAYAKVRVIDSVKWCLEVADRLEVTHPLDTVVVHPGCSITRLGLDAAIRELAGRLSRRVIVPSGTSCCGMAGDRGLLHPELVESATREECADLPTDADAWLASNRTCEIGLAQATGHTYESVVFALERATRQSHQPMS